MNRQTGPKRRTCLLGVAVLLGGAAFATLTAAPASAQEEAPGYATPRGSIGLFAWYANGAFSSGPTYLYGNGFLPGLAGSIWINPWFSIGAWAETGAFQQGLSALVGPYTNGDLEFKFRLGQAGTGLFATSLTADVGGEIRSTNAGTGTSPKIGGIVDVNLPKGFSFQGRLDWAPWLNVSSVNYNVFDYKLGFGHLLFRGLGIDFGFRGQTAVSNANTLSLNGPYLGFGWVF